MTEVSGRSKPAGPTQGVRPHFTGRAAILAIVICAVALSLAYPVREYIAQRRQIDQLLDRRNQLAMRLKNLERERRQLDNPVYIERLARDRLHMCLPTQMCYVIISPNPRTGKNARAGQNPVAWYTRLWSSVQQANAPVPAPGRHAGHPASRHPHGPGEAQPG